MDRFIKRFYLITNFSKIKQNYVKGNNLTAEDFWGIVRKEYQIPDQGYW